MNVRPARFTALVLILFLLSAPQLPAAPAYRRVLVWLEGEALANFYARTVPTLPGMFHPLRLESSDLNAQRAVLRRSREGVLDALARMGFVRDGETDVVLHTLIGRMPEENIAEAQSIPGIRLLRPVHEYRPLLDAAVPLVRAGAVWPGLGGEERAGRGMRIAVIDSGIDISHPMLQDTRLEIPTGFPRGEREYTNSKVIVARNYLALLGDPRDAPSAMDRDGHGTFISAIAAGRRALAPLSGIVGVAPAAQLGSYRIFGSPLGEGVTTDAVIIAAINDAVADGMTVINLSIGRTPADLPTEEPVPQALTAAARAGVVVAAAAGNSGFDADISEPANSGSVIAVGASTNSRIFALPLRVTSPSPVPENVQRVAAVAEVSVRLTAPVGPAAMVHIANACQAIANRDEVRGKFGLAQDNTACSRSTKVRNLADAGALAAVIFRSDANDPVSFVVTTTAIPSFQISRESGEALAAFCTSAPGETQVTIDAATSAFPSSPDRIASFSSRGPSIANELKPDLVAPGIPMYSAFQINDSLGSFYSTTQFGFSAGTSFSTPIVAGAAALVKQAHPAWSPEQIKSAIVNTAAASVTEAAEPAPLAASGAGRLDVERAVAASAVFEPVSLSFGAHLFSANSTFTRTLKITNLGSAPEVFRLETRIRSEVFGASITIEPATTAPVGTRESTTVQVTLRAPAALNLTATADGWLRVRASTSGEYVVPFWGHLATADQPRFLFALRGDGQTGRVSALLPRPLAVQVADSDFIGLGGAQVNFEITRGAGTLSAPQVITDSAGVAAVTLRLPDVPGPVQVRASGPRGSFIFDATARPNPVATTAGVVNAASFRPGLAPGALFTIFGTGLAAGTAAAAAVPLPLALASAQVLFNGQPAPLVYASPGQINGQVPFELAGAAGAELRVSVMGVLSAPVTVPLAAAAPGIFAATEGGQNLAIALHGADFSPVSQAAPARAGEVVVLFAVGLGPVQPAVATGAPAPGAPAATTATAPVVRVGGATARVLFSGLAPGFVGLYQVNFEVPAVSAGSAPLILSVGASSSNTVMLPIQ